MKTRRWLSRGEKEVLLTKSIKAILNKAILHMDTHKHTYTDTDSALHTSESTEAGNRKRGQTLLTLVIAGMFVCLFVCLFG